MKKFYLILFSFVFLYKIQASNLPAYISFNDIMMRSLHDEWQNLKTIFGDATYTLSPDEKFLEYEMGSGAGTYVMRYNSKSRIVEEAERLYEELHYYNKENLNVSAFLSIERECVGKCKVRFTLKDFIKEKWHFNLLEGEKYIRINYSVGSIGLNDFTARYEEKFNTKTALFLLKYDNSILYSFSDELKENIRSIYWVAGSVGSLRAIYELDLHGNLMNKYFFADEDEISQQEYLYYLEGVVLSAIKIELTPKIAIYCN